MGKGGLSGHHQTSDTMISAILILNMVWFGAGAVRFALSARASSYGLVRREDATPRGREGVAGSLQFLGGLNLALSALAAMTLIRLNEFTAGLLVVPIVTFVVAHATQFAVNVPLAIREARGALPAWSALRGLMLFIFIGDAVLTTVTAAALFR